MSDECTPLMTGESNEDPHHQFCSIVGIPPSDALSKRPKVPPRSLYGRSSHQFNKARTLHALMASLSTTILLAQVMLGAAITALGASESSHILITVFGATNTVIAGVVAYLKSRGQPMRSRMFRDDLERVVDEIENSEMMWLGITNGIHGYDAIDIDDKVTVRSEVARLTRLYERAMRNNVLNNPDNYLMAGTDQAGTALRARSAGPPGSAAGPLPVVAPVTATAPVPAAPVAAVPAADPDESPLTAPPKSAAPSTQETSKQTNEEGGTKSKPEPEASKDASQNAADPKAAPPSTATSTPADPDESPASAARPPSPEPGTSSSAESTAPDS